MEHPSWFLTAIASYPKWRPQHLRAVLHHHHPKKVWTLSSSKIKTPHVPQIKIEEFCDWRKQCNPDRLWQYLVDELIHPITYQDVPYPKLLKQIPDAPAILFVRGKLPPPQLPLVAVVGSRKITPYGRQVIEHIVPPLTQHNVGVISGLAYGVDGHTHQTTLASGGYTAAILPGGCNDAHLFPKHHLGLARNIIQHHGAIISEFPPTMPSHKYSYPRRNRIIAGMCAMTLVIEAASKSGAKITARLALEYHRSVGAIPGSIFSHSSAGANELIAQGAYSITHPDQILQLLEVASSSQTSRVVPEKFTQLYALLNTTPQTIDRLIAKSNLPQKDILRTIMAMELAGFAKDTGGQQYIRL